MKYILTAALSVGLIASFTTVAPAQQTSPPAEIGFPFRAAYGTNYARAFQEPVVRGVPTTGEPLRVTIDPDRFLFDAACPDPDQLAAVRLLVHDTDGALLETVPLARDGARYAGQFTAPDVEYVRLGFAAQTASGWTAEDTRFDALYPFPVRSREPADLVYRATTRYPLPSRPLRPHQTLTVYYPRDRTFAALATDAQGTRRSPASYSQRVDGRETLQVVLNLRFLAADGATILEEQHTVASQPAHGTLPLLQHRAVSRRIPIGTDRVEVYFAIANAQGVQAWDSAFGANFQYQVQAPSVASAAGGLVGALPGQ